MKIDGVVVLYNPDSSIIENINSYAGYLDRLYVIDNSEKMNKKLISKIKQNFHNITYIWNGENKGIAYALDLGAKFAIENGAEWLLTMDQDSKFENNDIKKMLNFIENNDDYTIGIVSPIHHENEIKHDFFELVTMTSGNLVNLNIYDKIGGFLEKLFIDSVDTEYCLRLKQNGYKIKRINNVVLNHNLGNLKRYHIFGFKFYSTNHNFIRRYYITRNRFLVWNMYKKIFPKYVKMEKIVTLKEIIKILLAEGEKLKKIKYMIKGYIDYKKNKFGKLDN